MPDRVDVVDVEGGKVSLQYLAPGHVLATAGKDVGWLVVAGEPRYLARRFALEDGTWVPSDKHAACYDVAPDGSKIVETQPPREVREAGMSVLLEAVVAWHASRPDLAARAVLDQATHMLRKHRDEVAMAERHLAELRAATPGYESALAEARAEVEAAEAGTDVAPAP